MKTEQEEQDAWLVLVTWPDGTEGLLFPRPGNVPIAKTFEEGERDFKIAVEKLREYEARPIGQSAVGSIIRLVRFRRVPGSELAFVLQHGVGK